MTYTSFLLKLLSFDLDCNQIYKKCLFIQIMCLLYPNKVSSIQQWNLAKLWDHQCNNNNNNVWMLAIRRLKNNIHSSQSCSDMWSWMCVHSNVHTHALTWMLAYIAHTYTQPDRHTYAFPTSMHDLGKCWIINCMWLLFWLSEMPKQAN